MDFQEFLDFVPKVKEVILPARDAHYKMAPVERIKSMENFKNNNVNYKIAAVMMLFYPKNGLTHLVLIVRNSYSGVHSAQIAFPGGQFETDDLDFKRTALRETQEEIGVESASIDVVRQLTDLYIEPSNFLVYPFLGFSKEELIFVPDPSEVSNIIEVPLSVLLDDTTIEKVSLTTSYAENIEVPAFIIEGKVVWGATAMMLSELKEVIKKVL